MRTSKDGMNTPPGLVPLDEEEAVDDAHEAEQQRRE
jgi:hypothetical protein